MSHVIDSLISEILQCRICEEFLPLGPNPVLRARTSARILIIGQAPGTKVHKTGIPWNDPSGDKLREWMGIDRELFYDETRIAIIPMGFCYPGKGKSGDLPPRPECAPQWHTKLLNHLPKIEMTLLAGSYAINYYLNNKSNTLKEMVHNYPEYTKDGFWPLVHPSPRNRRWLRNNPWFEDHYIPILRTATSNILNK